MFGSKKKRQMEGGEAPATENGSLDGSIDSSGEEDETSKSALSKEEEIESRKMEELKALADPMRKEVTSVGKKIDCINRELKPIGLVVHEKEKEYRDVLGAFKEKNKEKAQLVNKLIEAVDESLKSVNLHHGGIADKFVGKYSGGMKRRLSVAISLIGHSKVVYMDEPSTGLDPASRNSLWDVVRRAKQDRAIILTTHSMEEAEVLCDRLGIFVDGSLQCIGNPKELKARYGGSFVLTITTASTHEEEVERMVKGLSPSAEKIYQISGTQKFELPKQQVRISDVFKAVQEAKKRFTVNAWGVADTTLEDVFIKVEIWDL